MKNKNEFWLFVLIGLTLLLSISTFFITLGQKFSNFNNDRLEDVGNPLEHKPASFETDNSSNGLVDLLTPPEINYDSFNGFDKVYGLEEQIRILKEVQSRFAKPDQYLIQKNQNEAKKYIAQNTNKNTTSELPKGIIFYGPPGTGKTYLAKCCAKEFKMNFYIITPADSLKEIEEKFLRARKNSPSIIFADEAEEIVKTRNGSVPLYPDDTKKTDLILAEIDGVKTRKDKPIYFIAATNYLDKIDSAIQSRLEKMYLGNYKPDERLGYLDIMSRKYNIHHDAHKHLKTIVEKINYAEQHKEQLTLEIIKGIRNLPAIGLNERNSSAKTMEELFKQQDLLNALKEHNVKGIPTKQYLAELFLNKLEADSQMLTVSERDKFQQQYNTLSDDEYYMFVTTLDKVKTHFDDFTSARKLEFLINKAANKAGLYSKSRALSNGMEAPVILISDLEESLAEYLGTLSSKYKKETKMPNMPDNPVPPSASPQN
ncbi:ATP-binding protein ['Camptotheca acuminata' phytoplasma]|uniref:ATP-binding protein n=1 Tax='Camptotheca acuminata' phytoplasma TaxID=3239192 RepID=UPI00351A42E9